MSEVSFSSTIVNGILVSTKTTFKVGQIVYLSCGNIATKLKSRDEALYLSALDGKRNGRRVIYAVINNKYQFSFFDNMKIGQEVFCLSNGYGEVTYITPKSNVIEVCFDNKTRHYFNKAGLSIYFDMNGQIVKGTKRAYKVLNKK